MTVVIAGSLISKIAPSEELPPPEGAHIVDARGQFLIPGLWHMHVHLGNATEAALPVLVTVSLACAIWDRQATRSCTVGA